MPSVQNEAFGALVLSTHAHAKIVSVDATKALEMKGVLDFISHHDLPSSKANIWGAAALDEYFLAVDEVTACGQPIGVIVAKTKHQAHRAAQIVEVIYEDIYPVVLTIEEAIERRSFHSQYDRRIERGDKVDEVLASADHVAKGTTRMGGQEVWNTYTFKIKLIHSFVALLLGNYVMPRV